MQRKAAETRRIAKVSGSELLAVLCVTLRLRDFALLTDWFDLLACHQFEDRAGGSRVVQLATLVFAEAHDRQFEA